MLLLYIFLHKIFTNQALCVTQEATSIKLKTDRYTVFQMIRLTENAYQSMYVQNSKTHLLKKPPMKSNE